MAAVRAAPAEAARLFEGAEPADSVIGPLAHVIEQLADGSQDFFLRHTTGLRRHALEFARVTQTAPSADLRAR